ncbi:hypothetical protein TNCV_5069151 [Trichonephila clavipes]|nr:hypothetical protein TNCV_5069151 [Trichonephila clavipes]
MYPTCQQGNVQASGGFVMVCGLIWSSNTSRYDSDSDRYVSILSYHLHPFMSIVHFDGDLGGFSRTMRHPTRPELLQSGSRSTVPNLDTSDGCQNPQL